MSKKITLLVVFLILAVLSLGGYVAYTEGVKIYNAQIGKAYTKGVVDVFSMVKSKGQAVINLESGQMTLIEKK